MIQKMAMSSEERTLKVFNCQKVDRIPIFDSFWEEFIENWRKEKELPSADIYDYYGIDISIVAADETFFPSRKRVIKEDKEYIVSEDGWGATVRTKKDGYFYQVIDTVLNNKKDLEKLNFESPLMDVRYQQFLKTVEEEKKKKKAVFCKIGGPFIRSSFIRGEMNWFMDLAEDKKFAEDLAGKVGEHLLKIALESLRRGNLYKTGVWIYDDMGGNNAPLFSPAVFENIFFPIYKKMVFCLKKEGARWVILHSDGNILPFLDMVIEAGIDGINPVEKKAGMDIVKLKKKYGSRLLFIGGVDNAFILPSGDKEKVKRHVLPILELAKDGGVVVGAHSIGPDISPQIYDYYHNLIINFK